MGIRDSFSRLKDKIKHPLTGGRHKPDGTGADVGGERVHPEGSLLRPEPHVVADGSHGREDHGANSDGRQAHPRDQPPQADEPESVPARGSGNGQEGGETDVDGEVGQSHQHSHPDAEDTMECEPSLDVNDVDEVRVEGVAPTPPVLRSGKPDSM